jgi:hypothetical protein
MFNSVVICGRYIEKRRDPVRAHGHRVWGNERASAKVASSPPRLGFYWHRPAAQGICDGWEGAGLLGGSTSVPENDGLTEARVSAPSAVALLVRADAACDPSWRHRSADSTLRTLWGSAVPVERTFLKLHRRPRLL